MDLLQVTEDHQKVEIFLSCRTLKNKDLFSKSDPFVVFYLKQGANMPMARVGQTETINDNLNPNFSKSFIVDYIFELRQDCRFEVWDYDSETKSDFIGEVQTSVGSIVGARNQTLVLDLKTKEGTNSGKIILRCEKVGESREFYFMRWQGIKLINVDGWFDKSDPFLRFHRAREDGAWLLVHESEVIMDNLNPFWKPFEIKGQKLNNGDVHRPIKVECWDWEKNGKHQFMGECIIIMNEVITKNKREFPITNLKKKQTGTLKLEQFCVNTKPEFIDYIRGGLQLNLIIAVDFTGSNGNPSHPDSLHSIRADYLNQYQTAIKAVSEILLSYDYDQKIPCFGFGAKPRFANLYQAQVNHCFPLTGNFEQVEVLGLAGIMEAYSFALHYVELSGPTLFNPIITSAMQVGQVAKSAGSDVYNILLILTDGEIHDMDPTKSSIINSSHLPLSMIIVGVGNSDFTNMEVLDGDAGLVDNRGQKAKRDCVQFVPFRNFQGNSEMLSKAVLAEIPDQVVEYMRLIGKAPNPPKFIDVNQLQFSSVGASIYGAPPGNMPLKNENPQGYMPGNLVQSTFSADPYKK